MMKQIRAFISAAVLLALVGCASLHTYVPDANETTTSVQFLGFGKPKLWRDDDHRTLDLDVKENNGKRTMLVPANKRITIWVPQTYYDHRVVSHCDAALSLVPVPGQEVVIFSGIHGRQCTIEAVRINNSKLTGVAIDSSVAGPVNFQR
jgi:hypothetical protein